MTHISYKTHGVCSRQIDLDIDDNNVISRAAFTGGCSGNTQGIAALVVGMTARDAVERLKGIKCGLKSTSCPDQLATALEEFLTNK